MTTALMCISFAVIEEHLDITGIPLSLSIMDDSLGCSFEWKMSVVKLAIRMLHLWEELE